ncbi:MAG: YggS family pyridoxal phosphate enzyme [Rhodospirillaceae bacterium TMED8]|nr:YggS family pyridoxal phosphate-dependent enzyme [Magnetovibrio sp.]OUT50370.1 MAG: YggS family pyridoxal phosphate enzyme [Rhodospirillaceae bacterium TMED8]
MDATPENDVPTSDIGKNLEYVKASIDLAASRARRRSNSVNLVAISKTQKAERIRSALLAGHKVFGENRVQEASEKWLDLRTESPDAILHLIGPLQTNKVKRAVELFDVIQTIDRPKLARSLAREIERTGKVVDCFIQINSGEEAQKAGVLPTDADAFISLCRDELKLPIVGLMCIPPRGDVPGLHFGLVAELARRNGITGLSMGMSGDYEEAVRFGATHVRIGTAIFGARPITKGPDGH